MIESSQNRKIKYVKKLLTRKGLQESSLFIAEGFRFVLGIPQDYEVEEYFVSSGFYSENKDVCLKLEKRARLEIVSDGVFSSLSDTKTPQGILAVVRRKKHDVKEAVKKDGLYIILEDIRDPGNMGTIIRTSNACGVDAVFVSKDSTDVYAPKTLRSTMGAVFGIPVFEDADIKATVLLLKTFGVKVYAADLSSEFSHYDADYSKGGVAFLIGNEANGLKKETSDLADERIKIPMAGNAESLNASVASAVLMYEALRQRQGGKA